MLESPFRKKTPEENKSSEEVKFLNEKLDYSAINLNEYAAGLAAEEIIKDSYEIINPKEIVYGGSYEEKNQSGKEKINQYIYRTEISGQNYEFVLREIYAETEEDNGKIKKEINKARIDFNVQGLDLLTNIGYAEINKSEGLIRDFIRFLYSKNEFKYLEVTASKSDIFAGSEEDIKKSIIKKIDEIKDIPSGEFDLSPNLRRYRKISVNGDEIELFYSTKRNILGQQTKIRKFNKKEFIDFLKSDNILSDADLRSDVVRYIIDNNNENNKKQIQRLALYERKLKQMGFRIEKNGEQILAYTTDEALNKLYDFSKVPEKAQDILNELFKKM